VTLPVYYYHRVGPFRPGAPRKLNVDPAAFREHLAVLSKKAKPVSLDALVDAKAPRGAVAVTFDDGYRDLLEHALPALKEFRIPAAVFVVTDGAGKTDAWNEVPGVPPEPLLSWDDLKRLRDAGWTIGSHSRTHAAMDRLDAAGLKRETEESRAEIERRLGIRVRHFAYPQGRFTAEAEAAVAAAGYDAGWATRKGRPLSEGRTAIRRVPVSGYIRGTRFAWELRLMRLGIR